MAGDRRAGVNAPGYGRVGEGLSQFGQKIDWPFKALDEVDAFGGGRISVLVGVSDPRNVAHAKKVTQEKHHQEAKPTGKRSKEKKSQAAQRDEPGGTAPTTASTEHARVEQKPGDLEKSLAILSKLKEMEFHSRANIETLAELTLTIEEELKQREFSEPIGALYSAQDVFHSKIAALIEAYQAKCDTLK